MAVKCEKPMTENQKYYGNLLYKYLMTHGVVTKEEMFAYLGWNSKKDRQLRDLLSMIGKKVPLVSVSSSKGYFIAKTVDDLAMVENALWEWQSRKDEADERMKPLLEFRDKVKFGIGEKE